MAFFQTQTLTCFMSLGLVYQGITEGEDEEDRCVQVVLPKMCWQSFKLMCCSPANPDCVPDNIEQEQPILGLEVQLKTLNTEAMHQNLHSMTSESLTLIPPIYFFWPGLTFAPLTFSWSRGNT
jgi:hypothetical protein